MQKNSTPLSFTAHIISKRKIKFEFFNQLEILIDWNAFSIEIKKYYNKGTSVAGRPSYDGLLLFKMLLLQTWYKLSDYEVEDKVNDCLSFMKFVGLDLEDEVPDHSVLSRFRTVLTKNNALDKLMESINHQLEQRSILLNTGTIVDASITDTLRKPRGKKEYTIESKEAIESQPLIEDEGTQNVEKSEDSTTAIKEQKLTVKIQSNVDTDAAWVKKGGKIRYGYKKHVATNDDGLVKAIITTAANESDMLHLIDVVTKAKTQNGQRVRADKGYSSSRNRAFLKDQKIKDGIMHKAVKNKPLTNQQLKLNKIIGKTRFKIERTFGGIKQWFNGGVAKYIGIAKTHTQHILEAIAYNLYRSPGIAMFNSNKLIN